ncbi:Transcriptional regulatory protein pro1 [Aspergillus sclerotialis]|uniref:Transcriptional regulatory protein pro1 n=1 Tax=Aspergillus sclerotialis TaxID=2070753 RepID=A0A3A3A183_9EURO|nr:Transcriptional regulatory protein pro1 [Aspergillus sclerotialis]
MTSGYDVNRPVFSDTSGPLTAPLPTPNTPHGVDVQTKHQTFVNNVPVQHPSAVSALSATFPTSESALMECPQYNAIDAAFAGRTSDPFTTYLRSVIPVKEQDRPLLDHFLDSVLRLVFPVLELHSGGPARTLEILLSMKTNEPYLHCCLSAAALHFKTSMNLLDEQMDDDIVRHRFDTVSQLSKALSSGADHEKVLDATLAMIFFYSAVCGADDSLPDVPWYHHFQPVPTLLNKMSCVPRPFSTSLIAWIDIIGATMLGNKPQFARVYRTRHNSGTSSGLQELMGCNDRIMYLISEIACLDSLKEEGRCGDSTMCDYITALRTHLDHTEPPELTLRNPVSESGAIEPEHLTKNISSVFRIAAHIYLSSLAPGFNPNQPYIVRLVESVAEILQFIPSGPYGFDRSIVWPLLITGAFSLPSSPFRTVFHQRVASMAVFSDFGGFGRMYRVLQEVWRLSDDPSTPSLAETDPYYARSSSPSLGTGLSIRKQQVHWREVMRRNGWQYLML